VEKKYQEADEIRNRVLQMGFTIEDVQGGKFRILPKK
jgi:cysteinyl-tRNA synthetase